jgi:hypothetical protein
MHSEFNVRLTGTPDNKQRAPSTLEQARALGASMRRGRGPAPLEAEHAAVLDSTA